MDEKDYLLDFEKTIKNTMNDIRSASEFDPQYQKFKSAANNLGSNVVNEVTQELKNVKEVYNKMVPNQNTQYARQNTNIQRTNNNTNTISNLNYKFPTYSLSSIMCVVFGCIFAAFASITAMIALLEAVTLMNMNAFKVAFVALLITIVGAITAAFGKNKMNKIKHQKKCLLAIKSKAFIKISEIADNLNYDENSVYEDLKLMAENRYIKKAIFDSNHEYVFFDEDVYKQYLTAKERQNEQRHENEKRKEAIRSSQIVDDGFKSLKDMNDAINALSDSGVIQQSRELFDIAKKIMDYITDHPDQTDEIKKFTSYYLPSTANIIKTYAKFESEDMDSDDIIRTKGEIKEMLDVSAAAFKKILASLYDDDTMDVSTDIAAMKVMMAKEGLIDSFDINNKQQ